MRLFQISNLSHSFTEKRLFHNAELMLTTGEHIGLVGPNGCGKSTFLKILIGEFAADSCKIEKKDPLSIGYLDQYADIDKNCTVYEYLDSAYDELYAVERTMQEVYEKS